jgi:hypothetical protein
VHVAFLRGGALFFLENDPFSKKMRPDGKERL